VGVGGDAAVHGRRAPCGAGEGRYASGGAGRGGVVKVFITGGAGFIGSHMAERLVSAGHSVLVLDDLSTGQMSNLDPLIGKPGFDYRIGSVEDEPLVGELVDRCDVTVHL